MPMETRLDDGRCSQDVREAARFKPPETRRDFLGLAAAWSAISAFAMALLGSLRLPMPSVFPESDARVKLGKPGGFAPGSTTYFPQQRLWLYRGDGGFHALSAVCTHLQCTVQYRSDREQIWCACHNGFFDLAGRNIGGPPPRPLDPFDVAVRQDEVVVSRRA